MSKHICPFSAITTRWERRKDARPQELLAAALELFVERGFAATRLDDVAKAAGVSKGTLYLYYKSKEELFKAVVRENMVPSIGEAEGLIEQFEGDSETLFRLIATRWWATVGQTKLSGLTKLMMAEAGNFPDLAQFYHDEVVTRADKMVVKLLERGIARGEIREIDLAITPRLLIAPMLMMTMWKHSYGVCQVAPAHLDAYLERYIDLALHSVLIKPPATTLL